MSEEQSSNENIPLGSSEVNEDSLPSPPSPSLPSPHFPGVDSTVTPSNGDAPQQDAENENDDGEDESEEDGEGDDDDEYDDDDEEDDDDDDNELTLQDIHEHYLRIKAILDGYHTQLFHQHTSLPTLYEIKTSLASLNGNLEDLQFNLDTITTSASSSSTPDAEPSPLTSEEKNLKREILHEIENLFELISLLNDQCEVVLEQIANQLKQQGNQSFKEKNYLEAIESYTLAIRVHPLIPQYYTNRALAYQKLASSSASPSSSSYLEDAIQDSKYAISLDVNYLKAYIILMKSYAIQQNYEKLLEVCHLLPNEFSEQKEVMEIKENASVSTKDLGNSNFKQGKMTEALQFYSLAIEFNPKNHVLYSNRSAAYQSKGQWKEALKDGEKCIQCNEFFPKGYLHIARAQVQLQRLGDAEITISLAKKIFETDRPEEYAQISTQCQEILADIAARKGSKGSLNNASASAASTNLAKAEQFKQTGNKYYKDEDYSEAIRYYSQAISLCPEEPAYYGNRSAAWLMMKEYKRAITDCTEGLKYEPIPGQLDKLRLRQATALASMGSLPAAMRVLEEAIALPDRGGNGEGGGGGENNALKSLSDQLKKFQEVSHTLALANESLGKGEYSRAKRLYQISQGTLVDDPVVAVGIAKACFELGEYEDSSRAAQKVIVNSSFGETHDRIEAYVVRSDALQAMGCTDLAQKHLLAALQLDPDNATLQIKLKAMRRLISEIGRLRQAIDHAMNHRKFEEAIRSCAEGMRLEGITKKFLGEFHERRSKAYSMKAKLVMRTSAAAGAPADTSDATSPPVAGAAESGDDVPSLWKRCLQDANSSLYYDKSDSSLPAIFLRCEALQALGRHEEALDELKSCFENGPGKGNETIREKHKEAQFLLKKSKRIDLYQLLGCSRGELSSEKEIRVAYKKAALKWHPDRHSSADANKKLEVEKKFKEISDAHELLLDPQRRALYDQGFDREEIEQRMEQQQQQHYGHGGGFGGHHFGGGRRR
jgi:DnaJ homolog subfamily C member 7